MKLQLAILDQIRNEWNAAEWGKKSQIIRKWADLVGVSYGKLYSMMELSRQRTGRRLLNGVETVAMLVAQIKKRPPADRGEIATEDAVAIAIGSGLIDGSWREKIGTINRVIREMGLKPQKRYIRFQAERPNQMHHVDASTSSIFYIKKAYGDGDYLLKLHRSVRGYKNKPVPVRLRPWIYGLVDDYSGCHVARYIAAEGESMADSLDFLCWAWGKSEDKVLHGIPDRIKFDHGPLMKGDASRFFLERLGVEIDGSTPENKNTHGKIERPWRTMWNRFELPFFVEDFKSFEISLSELNRKFLNYQAAYNEKRHRFERTITRREAWQKINRFGGAVALPPDAINKVVRRYERTVDGAGVFWKDSTAYEVRGCWNEKVWVYEGIFNDRLIVESKKTGQRFEVQDFKPNGIGEFRSQKESPHDKAIKAAASMTLANTLYDHAGRAEKTKGNVVAFPTVTRISRIAIDDMSADQYRSLNEAAADFVSLIGFYPEKEVMTEIRNTILDCGLSKSVVREMADMYMEGRRRRTG